MARVNCSVDYTTLENDEGFDVDSVVVECSRCGHTTESFGQSSSSVRRCLALMGEQGPNGERNYYVAEE